MFLWIVIPFRMFKKILSLIIVWYLLVDCYLNFNKISHLNLETRTRTIHLNHLNVIKVVSYTVKYKFLLRTISISILVLEISCFEKKSLAPFWLKLSLKAVYFLLFKVLHTFFQGCKIIVIDKTNQRGGRTQ